jgi:hypothetical protein
MQIANNRGGERKLEKYCRIGSMNDEESSVEEEEDIVLLEEEEY